MKYLFILLFICFGFSAIAQSSPLFMPVHLVDGSLFDLVHGPPDPEAIRKAGLKSITVFHVEIYGERHDTFRYKEIFSSRGDQIFYHHEFKDFGGFNNISYNSKGTMAVKQWKSTERLGCGTGGITNLLLENYTHYSYHKKKLVLSVTSTQTQGGRWHDTVPIKGLHTAFTYNKKGLNISEESYYLPDSLGKDTLKYTYSYRYNNDGKRAQMFYYQSDVARQRQIMDSLIGKASDQLSTVLLRQSPEWSDTVKAYTFPEMDDETVEAYQARTEAIDLRDSADDVVMDFYENDKNSFDDFVGYDYNSKGLLISKMHFKETNLSLKDTFIYNNDGQLVFWETWHLDNDNDFQPWERKDFNTLPLHSIWTFTYDKKGRVQSCTLKHFASPQRSYNKGQYDFKPEKEVTCNIQYNASGKVEQVQENITAWHYGYNPEFIKPITHDTVTYYVDYEKW